MVIVSYFFQNSIGVSYEGFSYKLILRVGCRLCLRYATNHLVSTLMLKVISKITIFCILFLIELAPLEVLQQHLGPVHFVVYFLSLRNHLFKTSILVFSLLLIHIFFLFDVFCFEIVIWKLLIENCSDSARLGSQIVLSPSY